MYIYGLSMSYGIRKIYYVKESPMFLCTMDDMFKLALISNAHYTYN